MTASFESLVSCSETESADSFSVMPCSSLSSSGAEVSSFAVMIIPTASAILLTKSIYAGS